MLCSIWSMSSSRSMSLARRSVTSSARRSTSSYISSGSSGGGGGGTEVGGLDDGGGTFTDFRRLNEEPLPGIGRLLLTAADEPPFGGRRGLLARGIGGGLLASTEATGRRR